MPKHRALQASFAAFAAFVAPDAGAETVPVRPCPGALVTPVNLDPHGDNNLSVRSAPRGGKEIDELFTGDLVCGSSRSGAWVHVQYIRDGRGVTGWAYSGYLRAVTANPDPSGGGGNTSVTQQQLQQKNIIINVNPNIGQ